MDMSPTTQCLGEFFVLGFTYEQLVREMAQIGVTSVAVNAWKAVAQS